VNYSSSSKYKLPQKARQDLAFLAVPCVLQQPKQRLALGQLRRGDCAASRKSWGTQRYTGQNTLPFALQMEDICFKGILYSRDLSARNASVERPLLHPEGFTEQTAASGQPGFRHAKSGLWSCKGS